MDSFALPSLARLKSLFAETVSRIFVNLRYSSHLVFYPTAEFDFVDKIIFGFCLYVSVCLILRMWLKYRTDKVIKKLLWSVVLLMPLAGWVFYAGLYHNPYSSDGAESLESRPMRKGKAHDDKSR